MMPTMVLFFTENGLTMQQVFILQTFFSIAIFALEIPSGYIADSFGRKNSIVLGSIIGLASFIVYALSYSFWPMVLAETLLGIGFAFISGADSALLYESMAVNNETDDYRRREGHMQFSYVFSEAVGSVFGGYLALISLRTPMYGEVVLFFLLVLISLSLTEVGWKKESLEKKAWSMRRVIVHTFKENKVLRWLSIYYALISTAGLIVVWFRQPYFQELGIGVEYFGYLWALLMLAVSLASLSADWLERTVGMRRSLSLLGLLGILGFLLIGAQYSYWGILAMVLFCFMRGLAEPIISHHIQRFAVSEVRATMLSIKGFIGRGLFAVAGPFAGWASDVYSLQFALIASGVIFGLLSSATLIALLRYEQQERLIEPV